jgi:hypothetical protein
VEDLSNALWDKIEEREAAAEELRQELMTNQWLENKIEDMLTEACEILNAESAYFFLVCAFLQDFVLTKHQLPLNELPDNAINLFLELPLLDGETSPRLEKIVEYLLAVNPLE